MSPKEASEIVQILERSREEFNAAAIGVTEAHALTKPEPDRWSVLDCVEHVAFVEGRFLGWLQAAPRENAPPLDKQKEADLGVRVPNRSVRAQAPEAARPTGRYASLAEALDQFNAARDKTIEFAEACGPDIYALALEHPRFGKLNGMEFLMVVAGHARRHAEQIRETRTVLGMS